ncbi:MAG: glycoside hydrolase family 3 C-terminal domain-containing protein [Candidatus Azobacteroides sp.]|nr:glycoside hydrolase family 3 C-terminal domain-containing protein [Candidatus Azobacteroides sp.]
MNIKYLSILFIAGVITACTHKNTEDTAIDQLLSRMTLEEKIGQMNQLNYEGNSQELDKRIKAGEIGSLLNVVDPVEGNRLQKIAVEESRLGIPLIIGRDVIHGFKTIFPIPLGQAASFNPQIVEKGARIAATEARSVGIHWTFAPMLDISRDARWGRIAESLGEDPYLASVLGAAMVKGFQTDSLSNPTAIAACVKHFVGYGAGEGGRDYNSTNIPPHLMRNVYLRPFESAIHAGAATVMTSFNDNDGVPSSGNTYLLRNVLRDEWKFDGFVVSDWASITEMIAHGFAQDDKQAAEIASNAGLDMEMVSGAYAKYLPELVRDGKVSDKVIDEAVRHILRIKYRLGLFDHPYADTQAPSASYAEESLATAKEAAIQSAILLKNANHLLPLNKNGKIAVIGPMADAPHEQLGTWVFDSEKERSLTPIKALQTMYPEVKYRYEPALAYSRDSNKSAFSKARAAAQQSDVAVVFLGEESILSGEAHCLANIDLVGVQSDLLREVKSTGKPVVLVIMAGRPLTIEKDLPYADAVLYNFHPGTMGGPAIWDLLFGNANPSGKLPVTFVRHVGQIPLYYNHNNTGRPAPDRAASLNDIPVEAEQTSLGNTSHYLDYGKNPLFPFGYGLSYTTFEYSNLQLSAPSIQEGEPLTIQATVANIGNVDGTEVVQLYVQDVVGSIARPVKELKGFSRVSLKAGEAKVVEFTLTSDDLAFWGRDRVRKAEPGDFNVWVGGDSNAPLKTTFTLVE